MENFPKDVVEERIKLLIKERCVPIVSVVGFSAWGFSKSVYFSVMKVATEERFGIIKVNVYEDWSRITFNDIIVDGPSNTWFNIRLPDPTAVVLPLSTDI